MTKIEFGLYLKELREKRELSLRKVDELTNINYSHLNQIEHGQRNVTPALLKNLSSVYKVYYMELFEKAGYVDLINNEKQHSYTRIPVLGNIPAGIPIELIEDNLGYEDISEDMLKGGKEYFAVKVQGNSMEPQYLDGDVLIVLKQNSCENKQDCIVMVNGDDGTFKRVFISDTGITLQPLNNEYMPVFYTNKEVIEKPVKILGVVKEIRRSV